MSRPLRILLTHVYCWPEVRRGGERILHESAAALRDAGHDVRILSSAPTASSDEVLGVPVQRLRRRRGRTGRYGDLAPEVAFARDALWRRALDRFDVWHAFGTADAAAAASLSRRRGRVRSVYTDLGGPLRSYRSTRPDHRLFEYAVKHLDAYLCLSETSRRLLESDYGRRGLVVTGGVDLDRFRPVAGRDDPPTVLFTSALDEPRKNLPLLLAAFDLVLAQRPEIRLCLAAPQDRTDALDAASDRVRVATTVVQGDPTDQLPELYAQASVTVLPAMREAFGLVLVESLACGTPVVALEGSGGPAEIVQPGVGVLAPEATPASLAAAIGDALVLARRPETHDACRAEAVGRYGWAEAIAPRLERVYRGELDESG